MALPDIRKIPPDSIYEFRCVSETEPLHIPEIPENRKCTDVFFLAFFIFTILLTVGLVLGSSVISADYKRFLNGYDKCGDTCGAKNLPIFNINCSGKDLTARPFIKMIGVDEEKGDKRLLPDECVDTCEPPNRLLFHRCVPPLRNIIGTSANWLLTLIELIDDLKHGISFIVLMVAMGLVLSLAALGCFLWSPRFTVCGVLVFSPVFLLLFTVFLWIYFTNNKKDHILLGMSIAITIATIFLLVFICYYHNRYSLIIEMFIEAMKVTYEAPWLLLVPLLILVILTIVVTILVFAIALLSTNQDLKPVKNFPDIYEYEIKPLAQAAITYLALTGIWIFAIANGCQCFIVAGPVAEFYFRTDETQKLHFSRSVFILFRYHFGTIAFGSFCVTLLSLVRFSLEFLQGRLKCKRTSRCLECVVAAIEQLVEYLTRRAYIQNAMHGRSMYKSGMRAARLLWANLMDTLSLDVVADFIMMCATILVMLACLGVAMATYSTFRFDLNYVIPTFGIGVVIVGTTVYFILQIINVAVETIFLCFCEDKLLNDGGDRPYQMSPGLKALVERAKKVARGRKDG